VLHKLCLPSDMLLVGQELTLICNEEETDIKILSIFFSPYNLLHACDLLV